MKPDVFEVYDWAFLQDLNRLAGVTAITIICNVIDMNNFLLKYMLWIPMSHNVLLFRVLLLGTCCIPAAKEWYEFISNEHCHRLGPFAWCCIAVSTIEMLAVLKFQDFSQNAPFPLHVIAIWTTIGAGYLYMVYLAWQN
jgi:phosphatidylserine synthase 2